MLFGFPGLEKKKRGQGAGPAPAPKQRGQHRLPESQQPAASRIVAPADLYSGIPANFWGLPRHPIRLTESLLKGPNRPPRRLGPLRSVWKRWTGLEARPDWTGSGPGRKLEARPDWKPDQTGSRKPDRTGRYWKLDRTRLEN